MSEKEKETLLFVASAVIDMQQLTGVTKKILNQKKAFEKDYHVVLVGFTPKGVVTVDGDRVEQQDYPNRRKARTQVCIDFCQKYNIRKCYIRNGTLEPYYIGLLKQLHKRGVTILQEIPTYPYDAELKHSLKSRIILLDDKMLRPLVKKYVTKIVTFFEYETIFGLPCIITSNGVDVNSIPLKQPSGHDAKELHLIGVALVSDYHGFDRIISGMAQYAGDINVVFHIVGNGPAIPALKRQTAELGLEDKVIFHGFQSGQALEELYTVSDIAVSTLAYQRVKIKSLNALKTREYAAKGMLMICDRTSVPQEQYSFAVPLDDSAVDIEALTKWYSHAITDTQYQQNIRQFALENYDIHVTMRPVLEYFNSI